MNTTVVKVDVNNTDAAILAEAINGAIEQTNVKAQDATDPLVEMGHHARAHRLRTIRNALVEASLTPQDETITVR